MTCGYVVPSLNDFSTWEPVEATRSFADRMIKCFGAKGAGRLWSKMVADQHDSKGNVLMDSACTTSLLLFEVVLAQKNYPAHFAPQVLTLTPRLVLRGR